VLDLGKGMDITEEVYIDSQKDLRYALIGDIHIAGLTWLKDFTEWMFDYLKRYRIPWCGMGDYLEYATKNSIGIGVYEQTMTPDLQKRYFKQQAKPIRKRCTALHDGNHDKRGKDTGMTELVNLCEFLDVPYANSFLQHTITVGDYTWKMITTHGSSGAKLPHTKINSTSKMSEKYKKANIFAMGHVHRLEHKPIYDNYVDVVNGRQRVIREHTKSLILTGHFLDYPGSYAQDLGLHPEPAGFPILHFRKDGTFEVEKIYAPEVICKGLGDRPEPCGCGF